MQTPLATSAVTFISRLPTLTIALISLARLQFVLQSAYIAEQIPWRGEYVDQFKFEQSHCFNSEKTVMFS